ncbi:hypothetical protein [Demequina sp. NBRC 110056]|uniref:hypothetical protein n=1 Tax=Demequina sp. NBRC 110056 TaxID=1570345 RepID=UPI001180CEC2|nr:hypothetical protein [Demequina sp. NBRC 110056]
MRSAGRLLGIVALGAAAILAVAWVTDFEWGSLGRFGEPRNVLVVEGEQIRIPEPPGDPSRLVPAVPVTTDGAYAFMFEEDGQGPTRYDPCQPLRWVLNPDGMPEGAEEMVHLAVADVSEHTGLVFRDEGRTDEVASFDRDLFQERYGDDFAPIVVGWSTAAETPELTGAVTGLGGSSSVNGAYGEQRYLAAGVMILDAPDMTELMETDRGADLATAVIKHELAHVVGLAHVDDPTELMNAENRMLTDWGPGDLAGLAIVGNGPCQE